MSHDYNNRSRMTAAKQGPQGSEQQLCGYAYDAAGRPVAKALANGITTGYSYDDAGQLTTLNSQLSSISYSYNNVGNRTSMSRSDTRAETYGYDATDQLVAVNYGAYGTNSAHTATYGYDPVGNRWLSTQNQSPTAYAANALNQYVQVGGQLLHYDANGNLISQPGWTYYYDAFNRLISARSTLNPQLSTFFAYDGRNRFRQRIGDESGSGLNIIHSGVRAMRNERRIRSRWWLVGSATVLLLVLGLWFVQSGTRRAAKTPPAIKSAVVETTHARPRFGPGWPATVSGWRSRTGRSKEPMARVEANGEVYEFAVNDVRGFDRFYAEPQKRLPVTVQYPSGRPGEAVLVAGFCRDLQAFQKETKDPWIHKWEYE